MLSATQVENAYDQALDILEKIGVGFGTEKSLAVFKKHGFRVDGNRVCMSRGQVREYLALMPEYVYPPVDKRIVRAGTPFLNAPMLYDDETKKFRRPTLKDVVKSHIIAETSDLYEFANPGLIDPIDLQTDDIYASQVAMTLRYTSKPLNIGIRATINCTKDGNVYESEKRTLKMVKDFYGRGDEIVYYQGICPFAPLAYDVESLENLDALIEEKQGITLFPCTISYLTGPETLMGLAVHDLALCLAGIVYVQMLSPGTDLAMCCFSPMIDIRTLQPSFGAPEYLHIQVMFYEVCKHLGINCTVCGITCDNLDVDFQGGVESVLTGALPFALTELGEMWCYPGSMAGFAGASFEKLIFDEDVIRILNRTLNQRYEFDSDLLEKLIEAKETCSFLHIGDMELYRRDRYMSDIFVKKNIISGAETNQAEIARAARQEIERRVEAYKEPDLTREQLDILRPFLPAEYR